MKTTKILYWVFTGLFAAMMLLSAIPDLLVTPDAVNIMSVQLGYPDYFIPFIGVAKVLGVIAILVPGFPRIKEWAYAGLFFDLIGAAYSSVYVLTKNHLPLGGTAFLLLPIGLGILSYNWYHKLQRLQAA